MLLNPNFRLCCTQSLHSSCFCVYLLRCSLFNWMYMCFFFWSKYTPCHFHYLECGYKMFLHCVYSLCSHNVNRTCTQSSIYNCTTGFESSFPFLSAWCSSTVRNDSSRTTYTLALSCVWIPARLNCNCCSGIGCWRKRDTDFRNTNKFSKCSPLSYYINSWMYVCEWGRVKPWSSIDHTNIEMSRCFSTCTKS